MSVQSLAADINFSTVLWENYPAAAQLLYLGEQELEAGGPKSKLYDVLVGGDLDNLIDDAFSYRVKAGEKIAITENLGLFVFPPAEESSDPDDKEELTCLTEKTRKS